MTDDRYRYFVYSSFGLVYRVYGTQNYVSPKQDDPRCIWRGDDYSEGLRVAKEANSIKRKAKKGQLIASSHELEQLMLPEA